MHIPNDGVQDVIVYMQGSNTRGLTLLGSSGSDYPLIQPEQINVISLISDPASDNFGSGSSSDLAVQTAYNAIKNKSPSSVNSPGGSFDNLVSRTGSDLAEFSNVGLSGNGALSVNPQSGSVSFSMPIAVPAGKAGVAPKLAITYGAGSLVGQNMTVSGLGAISRCARSKPINPKDQSVYENKQAFCLNGQQLIKVGDHFRTRIDSFQKILPLGSDKENPVGFKVLKKSGEISVYGQLSFADTDGVNSVKTASAIGRYHWGLRYLTNRQGVGFTVKYKNPGNNAALLVDTIDYDGGQIKYNYGEVDSIDKESLYVHGELKILAAILDNITVTTESGQQFSKYKFTYNSKRSELTNFKYLAFIDECTVNDSSCLRTKIDWTKHDIKNPSGAPSLYRGELILSGSERLCKNQTEDATSVDKLQDCQEEHSSTISYPDINGDGFPELCYRQGDNIRCHENPSAKWIRSGGSFVNAPIFDKTIIAEVKNVCPYCSKDDIGPISWQDIDSDGAQELVVANRSKIDFYEFRKNSNNDNGSLVKTKSYDVASRSEQRPIIVDPIVPPGGQPRTFEPQFDPASISFITGTETVYLPYTVVDFVFLDYNGDRQIDICYRIEEKPRIACSDKDTKRTKPNSASVILNTSYVDDLDDGDFKTPIYPANVDGVGSEEIILPGRDAVRIFRQDSSGSYVIFDQIAWGSGEFDSLDNYSQVFTPDINGDGLVEICARLDVGGITCSFNTGVVKRNELYASDLLETGYCKNSDSWCDRASPSNGREIAFSSNRIQFIDVNDDGRTDLFFNTRNGARLYLNEPRSVLYSNGNQLPLHQIDWFTSANSEFGLPVDFCKTDDEARGCDTADNHHTVSFLDYNADGYLDIVYRSDDKGMRVIQHRATGQTAEGLISSVTNALGNTQFVEYKNAHRLYTRSGTPSEDYQFYLPPSAKLLPSKWIQSTRDGVTKNNPIRNVHEITSSSITLPA